MNAPDAPDAPDERMGLDSASSAYRRRRCAGSANLVRALRKAGKLTQTPSKDALSGSRVHRAWCGEKLSDLTPRETETLSSLKRMEAMLVTDWARGELTVCLGREVRLWLHEGLDPVHSGAFDVAYSTLNPRTLESASRMLIIDGKTLFGEVSPAEENDQLRELVALARANFSRAKEFTVAILQPWVSQRPSVALYDATEAELALRELRRTIADNADPDAPRTAGVWCDKCPAFELCDTARGFAARTWDVAKAVNDGFFVLPIGHNGAKLLDAAKLAQKYLEAVLKRYKEILANDPEAVPGWLLRDGNKVREITDVEGAAAIAPEFMSRDEFYSTVSVDVGALQELCARASGLRGRALEDLFNQRFSKVIHYRQNAPMLVRAKNHKPKELG